MKLASTYYLEKQLPMRQVKAPQMSIIIPVLNGAHIIGTQLDALAAEAWEGTYEVIIVDNGSSDRLAEALEPYYDRLPHLRLIEAPARQSGPHARNTAVAEARGELLLFLDADDMIGPGFVAAMAAALERHDIVAPRLDTLKLNQTGWSRLGQHRQYYDLMRYYNEPYLFHVSASGLGIRRSMLLRLGGFDESMPRLADSEFCFRAQSQGCRLHFVPAAVVHYRNRTTLRGLLRQSRDWGRAELLLVDRYRGRLSLTGVLLRWVRYIARWAKLAAQIPTLRTPEQRNLWLQEVARNIGVLEAAIRRRQAPI